MNTCTQLTREQRYQIKALLDTGHSQAEVAQQVEVSKSTTISREVRRNRGQRDYRPKQAHEMALDRQRAKAQTKLSSETWALVMDRINPRPRKCLDFRSPFEVFFGHQPVALTS